MRQPQPQKVHTESTGLVSQVRPCSLLSLSCSAPVGQAETQLPQSSHCVSTMERWKEVAMTDSKPRSAKSSTSHPWTS